MSDEGSDAVCLCTMICWQVCSLFVEVVLVDV